MKRKLSMIILTLTLALCSILGLTACGGNNENGNGDNPPHTHEFTTLKYDTTNHWFECECGDKKDIENHKGGLATETSKAVCEICNQEYGSVLGHSHTFTEQVVQDIYLKEKAKCESKAQYYYSCECGEKGTTWFEYGEELDHSYTKYVYNNDARCEEDGTETALCDNSCGTSDVRTKSGTALDHDYSDWVSNSNGTHKKVCKNDNSHVITDNCSGGTATCTKKAVCDDCGIEYGSKKSHSYSILKQSATQHWYECTCGEKKDIENHKGGIATCTEKAKCSVCNQAYGDYAEHTYSTEWVITDTYHYQESTCGCNVKKDYGVHVADAGNFCSTCDKILGATTGIIYDISSDGTYYEVIGYNGTAKRINIADTYQNLPVKNIYNSAFANNDNITTVIIPDGVESIGSYAFYDCSSLTSVVIGDGVTSIGDDAFSYCSKLTSIEIPNSVTSIGYAAFFYCSSLTSVIIGDGVTSIGGKAFYDCTALTSVTIGNSVTSIGDYAFCNSKLTSIEIPNSVTSIGKYAFSGCNSALYTVENNLKYVKANGNQYYILIEATNKNFSTYQINANTKYIGSEAFYSFDRLTSIVIPNSVTSIGYAAFSYCSSLTSVAIPESVTSIDSFAFYKCSSLTSVTIPNSVTSIGKHAFSDCSSLTNIMFSDTSTWYRTTAFANWQNMSGGTAITVTNSSTNATYFTPGYSDYYWYKK